ncbi:MAG: meso-butanediol dehydrogenase / (S,S)-butanediol dehydrogenase / diacetyl reductase [Gammaproteobacteria bacterium]|jgi:NAD(P)-dependent dehydrogenase (short-subunit alcohol dehydrogenase family)|nr:meso-butanediol dehydrogenase / (S,S)-butanediol dehydrogenase / diacetyl reductase [Gammaproteobacteria bacterium]
MKLHEKIVLVTGGNSGIGRAIALRAVAEGASVAITGRDRIKGDHVLSELREAGANAVFFAADLGEEHEAVDLIAAVVAHFGALDVVVNNAGAGARRSAVDPEDGPGDRLHKLMRANLDAAYYVAAHALPVLRARGGGSIVNISSTAALHGTWGNYGIAKAAVEALTRSLAVQGAPHGIRANGVSPGWITTEVTAGHEAVDRTASLFGRMGHADEIARVVVFLASSEASFVTGQTLIVDGGLTIVDYPSQPWLQAVGTWKLFPDIDR